MKVSKSADFKLCLCNSCLAYFEEIRKTSMRVILNDLTRTSEKLPGTKMECKIRQDFRF